MVAALTLLFAFHDYLWRIALSGELSRPYCYSRHVRALVTTKEQQRRVRTSRRSLASFSTFMAAPAQHVRTPALWRRQVPTRTHTHTQTHTHTYPRTHTHTHTRAQLHMHTHCDDGTGWARKCRSSCDVARGSLHRRRDIYQDFEDKNLHTGRCNESLIDSCAICGLARSGSVIKEV